MENKEILGLIDVILFDEKKKFRYINLFVDDSLPNLGKIDWKYISSFPFTQDFPRSNIGKDIQRWA
jgi:hypothetical protein